YCRLHDYCHPAPRAQCPHSKGQTVTAETRARLFGYDQAISHPFIWQAVVAIAVVLAVAPLIILALAAAGRSAPPARSELLKRYLSWLAIVPLLLAPILLGAAWTIVGVTILSLLCYREYARATGLFREKLVSLLVTLGILAMNFAAFDHWYDLF